MRNIPIISILALSMPFSNATWDWGKGCTDYVLSSYNRIADKLHANQATIAISAGAAVTAYAIADYKYRIRSKQARLDYDSRLSAAKSAAENAHNTSLNAVKIARGIASGKLRKSNMDLATQREVAVRAELEDRQLQERLTQERARADREHERVVGLEAELDAMLAIQAHAPVMDSSMERSIVRHRSMASALALQQSLIPKFPFRPLLVNHQDLSSLSWSELEEQKALAEERREQSSLISRRAASDSRDFYSNILATYEFTLRSVSDELRPEIREVYRFLGLDEHIAKVVNADVIKELINNKAAELIRLGNRDGDVKTLVRQLNYIMRNDISKQEYDAFITGEEALSELILSSAQSDQAIKGFEQALQIGSDLDQALVALKAKIFGGVRIDGLYQDGMRQFFGKIKERSDLFAISDDTERTRSILRGMLYNYFITELDSNRFVKNAKKLDFLGSNNISAIRDLINFYSSLAINKEQSANFGSFIIKLDSSASIENLRVLIRRNAHPMRSDILPFSPKYVINGVDVPGLPGGKNHLLIIDMSDGRFFIKAEENIGAVGTGLRYGASVLRKVPAVVSGLSSLVARVASPVDDMASPASEPSPVDHSPETVPHDLILAFNNILDVFGPYKNPEDARLIKEQVSVEGIGCMLRYISEIESRSSDFVESAEGAREMFRAAISSFRSEIAKYDHAEIRIAREVILTQGSELKAFNEQTKVIFAGDRELGKAAFKQVGLDKEAKS